MYERVREGQAKVTALLEIVRSLHSDMGTIPSLTLTERTPALVGADRCTAFMVDKKRANCGHARGCRCIPMSRSC